VPEELREAAAGLLCATERCGGLPELQEVRGFLAAKFSSDFISVASELRSGCGVNPKVSHEPMIRVRRLMAWHETTAELARFERGRSHSRSWLMEWWPGGRSSGEGWPRAATREGNAAAWPEASGRWSRNADPCFHRRCKIQRSSFGGDVAQSGLKKFTKFRSIEIEISPLPATYKFCNRSVRIIRHLKDQFLISERFSL